MIHEKTKAKVLGSMNCFCHVLLAFFKSKKKKKKKKKKKIKETVIP